MASSMDIDSRLIWLQEQSALNAMPLSALQAIAPVMQLQTLAAEQTLAAQNTEPVGLYLL